MTNSQITNFIMKEAKKQPNYQKVGKLDKDKAFLDHLKDLPFL